MSTKASPNVVQRMIGKTAKVGDRVTSIDGSVWKIDEVSSYGGSIQYKISQVSGRHHMWNPRVVNPDDQGAAHQVNLPERNTPAGLCG